MSSPRALVVGSANLEVISTTDDPSINFYKTGTTDISYGGTARNISLNLSVMGLKNLFVTAHNASPISKMLVSDVVAFGSDAHCEINPDLPDSIFSGHILERELVSSIGSAPMERHLFSDDFVASCFDDIQALVFTLVISVESANKFIAEANKCKLPIFVCADSERRVLKILKLKGRIDYLFANKGEMLSLHKHLPDCATWADVATHLNTTIVVTDGPNPITVCSQGQTHTLPVPKMEIKGNTLGAGDFALSASIYFMVKNALGLDEAITEALKKMPVLLGKKHGHVGPGEQLALFIKRLTSTAETDPLTSLFNRRGLQNFYETDGLQNQRVAAVIIDIDHFKSVNDRFGHDVGDAVIKEIGAILRQHLRQGDAACRWGGEEFVFLTVNTAKDYLMTLVERLREKISQHDFEALSEHITISAGIATPKPNDSLDKLIKRADQALYDAKETGRNQVKIAV